MLYCIGWLDINSLITKPGNSGILKEAFEMEGFKNH
jgi:hypothetical protein